MVDLYDNSEPFYKNSDDLLDFIGDECNVNTFIVAKHVVTPPGTNWGELYRNGETTLDPVRIIKVDDLPVIFEAFMKVCAEAAKMIVDDNSEQITLKYPAKVEVTITAEQVKFFVDLACEATGKDMFELWNGRES